MSFDLVPADFILKIFHQLPFKDRVHLSGVNRLFRDVSMESIAKMKSLVVNNDLVDYSIWNQKLSSLLESCSATLEYIHVNNKSSYKRSVNALAEFVYPKLETLGIYVCDPDNGQIKKLISRNRNLRSVYLHLDFGFEWPDDIVFEKMEELELHACSNDIDLSPILRPLIGKVPNLKHLTIETADGEYSISLSAQEFSQLLASTPDLEKELYLDFRTTSVNISSDFKAAIPTWRLPKLTTLHVDLNLECPNQSSILHNFPASFPRLESFTSHTVDMDDQTIPVLSQLKHLRLLSLGPADMTVAEIIDVVTSIPSLVTLDIVDISEIDSLEKLIEFLKSSASIFRRRLVIDMSLSVQISEEDLEVLKELENSGGPAVKHRSDSGSLWICSIHYKSLDG